MTARPRVVVVGGGHGAATALEAVAPWAGDLTAVVSVADDGGSSGRLRADLGGIAPGDARRCVEALLAPGPWRDALGHRFERGDLDGHPAGNVLIAGLLAATGDPVTALDTLTGSLDARGRVLPATSGPVDLVASTGAGSTVRGQVAVSGTAGIAELAFDPPDPVVPAEVLEAIGAADLIVVGPGSLFTSVLAACVPAVRDAIAAAGARVVLVANLGPQAGEAEGLDIDAHVDAVRRHGVAPDTIVVDERSSQSVAGDDSSWLRAAVATADGSRHDPVALGRALSELVPGPAA